MKIKTYFLLAILLLFAVASNAQITYSGGSLGINCNPLAYPVTNGIRILSMDNLYWSNPSTNNYLEINMTGVNPAITGSNDVVSFYNVHTKQFVRIQARNVSIASDEKFKENIKTYSDGLASIMQLRPVTYNWKKSMFKYDSNALEAKGLTADKDENKQYGFIAQELEKIMPDIVETDENGNKLVNYIALIPVLVQSVQEMQATIESQALRIEELSSSKFGKQSKNTNIITSCLPNPTNGSFTAFFQFSEEVTNAYLTISSLSGSLIGSYNLSPSDIEIALNISSAPSGVYVLSLFVNNGLCDTCRIIKE